MNKLKNINIIFILTVNILVLFSHSVYGQLRSKINTIVLDAGHGGMDPGTNREGVNEKDITLAVVMQVGEIIKTRHKNLKVAYTRTEDMLAGNLSSITESLNYRAEFANQVKGDLFISVHVNASPQRVSTANGTATYVLGYSKDHKSPNDKKKNAIQENVENLDASEDLLNVNDPMAQIMIAQYTQAFLTNSISLGAKIEEQFALQGRNSHGVRQMPLRVLTGSAMPGVLIEIGFMNNPEERAYINSPEGQRQVAEAIYSGIMNYKQEVEKAPE